MNILTRIDGVPHFDLAGDEWIVPVWRSDDKSGEPYFYAHLDPHLDVAATEKALRSSRGVVHLKGNAEIPEAGDASELRALVQKQAFAVSGIVAQKGGERVMIEAGDDCEAARNLAVGWWTPKGMPPGIPPWELELAWNCAWERIEKDEAADDDEVLVARMGSSEDMAVGRDYFRFAFDPETRSTVRVRIRPRIRIGSEADHRRLQKSVRIVTKGSQRFTRQDYEKQRMVLRKLLVEVAGYCINGEPCKESNKDAWFDRLIFRDASTFALDHLVEANRGN